MRHEWTDKDGDLWYAKDGTLWGAEFGRIVSPGIEEEIEEGDIGAGAPLPEPALEILRLAAERDGYKAELVLRQERDRLAERVRELETRAAIDLQDMTGALESRDAVRTIKDQPSRDVTALEEENRRLRKNLGYRPE